jgi:tripartite-type tricarboxylate transporter receptor subunit TctC
MQYCAGSAKTLASETHTEGYKMKEGRLLILPYLALLLAGSAYAQPTYPEKPIRMIVGFPSGTQPDIVTRLLSSKLAESLGKSFIVENVTGAGGVVAADRLAKAAPDGYTLGMLNQGQIAINPNLHKVPYDAVKSFFAISQIAIAPNMLVVSNSVPAKNLRELIELARARPGALTFASNGSGSAPHMAGELFKSSAGVDIQHIAYNAGGTSLTDLLAGRVTMMFPTIAATMPMVRDGKLRALAVTSSRRSSAAPELPTVAESGLPGFEFTNWYGLFAPANISPAIVTRLHAETIKVLQGPETRKKFGDLGLEVVASSPDSFAATIQLEIPRWAKVIKDAGIKSD